MLNIKNTLDGFLKDVEIKGNTIQDAENLADIRSVGDKVEGQELYEIDIVSCGKNLAKLCKLLSYTLQEPNIKDEERRYATEELIPVKTDTSYMFSTKNSTTTKYVIWLDSSKNFISRSGVGNSNKDFKVQSPSNAKYCQLYVHDGNNTLNRETEMLTNEWQFIEGTQATPYEPYQEDKLTILSPVQLEKVGDVADRIVCKDGVWGVEKLYQHNWDNISFELPIGQFDTDDLTEKYNVFRLMKSQYSLIEKGIYPFFRLNGSYEEFKQYDGECVWGTGVFLYFKILKGKTTLYEFKAGKSFDFIVLSDNPQFIPLPHSQQVKLRTFAGQTNIHFETEIEGTIKAQVPKSIGATVNTHTEQINNLNNELDRVKKLEESTISTVTTESDFTTVEETSNGYFEDVKLEGKTLVNELGILGSSIVQNFPNNESIVWDKNNIKLNTFYTLVVDCKTNNASADIKLSAYELSQFNYATIMPGSFKHDSVIFKAGEVGRYITKVGYTSLDLTKSSPRITLFNGESGTATYDIMLLEGDHSQNPPSYFEGLMSVGQDIDEVRVESVNSDETQSNKKPLLYYNDETQTWEKPVLRQWDSIEKHSDGKYYYHKRSGEVVLNGSELDWKLHTGDGNRTTVGMEITILPKYNEQNADAIDIICDKLLCISANDSYGTDLIGVASRLNLIRLRLDPTKVGGTDLTSMKAWLQANPIAVVYKLAQEEVYECTNIDLITYENETNYIVNCGAIAPKSTLKVHSNISNVVKILQEKVNLLESNVIASQEVQDMMILESDLRILDIELALMEHMPITLNLGENTMLRSATYFNFLKNHIVNETYSKDYLENVMNKYLATGRINQDEYDELYKMLYPPVYDIALPIEE